mgnify:CR=1 FL=1
MTTTTTTPAKVSRSQEENVPQVPIQWYHEYVKDEIPDLSGKVAIVTGSNSGTGYWAARALALKNCTVILACRNLDKAKAAREEMLEDIKNQYNTENNDNKSQQLPNIDCIQLDNMDFGSVRSFAEEFNEKYDRLDYLLNNAGVSKLLLDFGLLFGSVSAVYNLPTTLLSGFLYDCYLYSSSMFFCF